MKLIIDTDAGVDDAQAIMLALSDPAVNVLAITTLTGNVHIRQVNPNVLTILEIMGRAVPVYAGIDRPLVQEWGDAAEFHGGDGLGNFQDRPPLTRSLEDEHAVPALLRLSREHAGELTLIALGPLTNIAAACRVDPGFPARIKQFVFMGGTIAAHGNTPIVTAEIQYLHRPGSGLYHAGRLPAVDHAQLGDDTGARLRLGQVQRALRHRHRQRALLQGDLARDSRAAGKHLRPARLPAARPAGDGDHAAAGADPGERRLLYDRRAQRPQHARADRHRLQRHQRQTRQCDDHASSSTPMACTSCSSMRFLVSAFSGDLIGRPYISYFLCVL